MDQISIQAPDVEIKHQYKMAKDQLVGVCEAVKMSLTFTSCWSIKE